MFSLVYVHSRSHVISISHRAAVISDSVWCHVPLVGTCCLHVVYVHMYIYVFRVSVYTYICTFPSCTSRTEWMSFPLEHAPRMRLVHLEVTSAFELLDASTNIIHVSWLHVHMYILFMWLTYITYVHIVCVRHIPFPIKGNVTRHFSCSFTSSWLCYECYEAGPSVNKALFPFVFTYTPKTDGYNWWRSS